MCLYLPSELPQLLTDSRCAPVYRLGALGQASFLLGGFQVQQSTHCIYALGDCTLKPRSNYTLNSTPVVCKLECLAIYHEGGP